MGVFDGGAYRVNVYRKSHEDPEDPETYNMDEAEEAVKALRDDSDVRAVEVFNLHYVIGNYRGDLSFGNPWEEEDE
jgi:hypothetical protein